MKNLKYLKCGQAIRLGKETNPGIEQVRKPMVVLAVLVGLSLAASVGVQVQGTCAEMQVLGTFPHHDIGSIKLYKDTQSGTQALAFASQMAVNPDGAPDAYHPDDIGIVHICNGINVGHPGHPCKWKARCMEDFNKAKAEGFRGPTKICFFAMVTDADGVPVIQKEGDPKPGYYISTTALQQPGVPAKTPQAQLDSNQIPFVVIPKKWQRNKYQGVQLGDFAVVLRKSTGAISFAIVGDLGPNDKLGEGAIALHQALGNDPFQIRYGKRRAWKGIPPRDVVYFLFPGSRKQGEMITKELIEQEGQRLLEKFGGEDRLWACAREM